MSHLLRDIIAVIKYRYISLIQSNGCGNHIAFGRLKL